MNLLDAKLRQPNISQTVSQKTEIISSAPIATTTLQKPDRPSKSYLVKEPFYYAPVNFVNDIGENLVNIGNGIKGHSNDHDLGRINDFTMRAGALALAGYLFTKARTPMSKIMEFIGFGSFFASMSLWPKLFIEQPLKAMYGVNVRQKYVDNEGRKKSFFQDPQYIPWNLYSDDELAKLGDKMGVPRDIHNRNEVIKKKAHKIALQGNTLWMLTAGFATPIMSALICNGAEKLISPQLEKFRIAKAEKDLINIDKVVGKAVQNYEPKKLNNLLTIAVNREISPALLESLVKVMHHDSDILEEKFVEDQLKELLLSNNNMATKTYAERFLAYFQKNASDTLDFPNEALRQEIMNLANGDIKQSVFHEKLKYLFKEKKYSEENIEELIQLTTDFRRVKPNTDLLFMSAETAEKIKVLDKKLYEFASRKGVIDRYKDVYLGDMAESFAANKWKKITETFFNLLGVKDSELKLAKLDGPKSYDLLMKKMNSLVSDENAYKKAVAKLQEAILQFDRMVLPDDANGASQGVRAILDKQYSGLIDSYAKVFGELGFGKIRERFVGDGKSLKGSLKANLNDRTFRRTWELRNNFYKLLHVLDCFKRASDVEKGWDGSKFAQAYRSLSQSLGGVELNPTQETLMKDLEQFKKIILSSTIADNTTKFGYSNAQKGLYERMMRLIYSENLDEATQQALKNETLGTIDFIGAFKKKIRDTLSNLGGFAYPHAEKVTVKVPNGWVGDILVRDSLCGVRIDKVFRETASNVYNSRKWLKMFGGAGLVLVATTLLSQMFFGRLPKREIMTKKDDN